MKRYQKNPDVDARGACDEVFSRRRRKRERESFGVSITETS